MISPGVEKAWDELRGLDPSVVCRNAGIIFDVKTNAYTLRSFCTNFSINLNERSIKSSTSHGEILITRYAYFFIHSCLWYLIHAKDIPSTGRLIRPETIQGGELFFRGSHVLPLDKIAGTYGEDKEAFIKRGREICAEVSTYGDASLQLLPMPRIPVILILWLNDKEFPARADLLFDSTCEIHLPLDILWSIAMFSLLVML
jgi:hypothetical protein